LKGGSDFENEKPVPTFGEYVESRVNTTVKATCNLHQFCETSLSDIREDWKLKLEIGKSDLALLAKSISGVLFQRPFHVYKNLLKP